MKKIIKLTESDLTRIVKRVINENNTKTSLIGTIKDEGFKSTSEMVGGVEILLKLLGVKSPMEFLHLFDDLVVVQSEKDQNYILFRYKPNHNVMVYDRKNDVVYVSYDDIWLILNGKFDKTFLNYFKTQELIKEWLGEVYNLRGVRPKILWVDDEIGWVRSTI